MIPPLSILSQPNTSAKGTQPVSAVRLGDGGRLLLVQSVPDKLPPLILGEQVSARVVERLDDYRLAVLIKGGLFTLNLPKGLQLDADTLTLRVATVKPELSFLLLESLSQLRGADSPLDVLLSRASRYLTQLLHMARPPLEAKWLTLDAATQTPAQLAHAIKTGVEKSGLFYESHLKAWDSGQLALEALKNEPQAALKPSDMSTLGYLLQQQLHTLENHQIPMQAYAWFGQLMSLLIEKEKPDHSTIAGDEPPVWSTVLALELPVLGSVNAHLRMVAGTIQIVFSTTDPATGQLIQQHRGKLEQNFELAGLSLATLAVQHEEIPT